jgi:DNA-binding CsgD family transcriptional regulator
MSSMPFVESKTCNAALSELFDIRDPQSLRLNLVGTIARRLIHAEDASFNHLDYEAKTARWDSIRPLPGELERMEACCRHFDVHPLVQMHRRPDSPAVLRLSDVLAPRTFERNPLYEELYRPIGIRHLMMFRPRNGARLNTIMLLRSNRDFSDREVRMFHAMAPLAAMLIKVATEREQVSHALAGAAPGRGLILLEDDDDFIAWANPCARQQMSRFFSWISQDAVPPKIAAWLASPGSGLLQAAGQSRLKVTLVQNGRQRMLLCDELPPEPAPQLLQQLGLTPRQAEVLFWISRGKTNAEIGIILGASVHTINRHVEAIFQRLNVESRSAAMVAALEVLGI